MSVGCRQRAATQALCESFVCVNIPSDAVGCGTETEGGSVNGRGPGECWENTVV